MQTQAYACAPVFQIRCNVEAKADGIDSYCKALTELFQDDKDVVIIEPSNHSVKKTRLLNDIYNIKELEDAIVDSKADIVHINGYTSMCTVQAFKIAHKLRKKIVYTAHWHPFKYLKRPLLGEIFFNIFIKPVVRKYADCVIALNNEDFQFFSSFCRNVVQIPHWMRIIETKDAEIAEKVPNMILFVGRVDGANKGIHHLYQLPEGKYEIHCVGNGTIKERSDIHHHVNLSNEELISLYRKASLLVVPSTYEAFSYAALESLYCGTPVVLSKGVRIADYLEDKDFFTLFDYNDYNAFERAVEETIGKKVDIDFIRRVFDKDKARESYKRIYTSL